jgi:hypothetical protein
MPNSPQKNTKKQSFKSAQFKIVTFTYDNILLFQTFVFHQSTPTLTPPKYRFSFRSGIFILSLLTLICFLINPSKPPILDLIDFLSYFNLFFLVFVFRWFKHIIVIFFFYFWNVFNNNKYGTTFITHSWVTLNYIIYSSFIYWSSVR